MPCAIVSGYSLDCRDTVGGIKNIYVTELANVTAVSENASGFITGITKLAGKKFFKYELEPRGQNNFTQAIQSDATVGTVAYEQTLTVNFVKLKYETQATLQNLIKNRLSVIIETKDGSYWLFGKENGLQVTGGNANSGQAMNEFQGYTLTLSGMEKNLANEVNGSIISGLLS